MRLVIDTNVIISGLFYGGLPNMLLELVVKNKVKHIASEEIIDEYRKLVKRISAKIGISEKITALDYLIPRVEIINPTTKIDICRDFDDNKFINCAIDGKCKYIISGDNDLLVIRRVANVEIVTVKEFLEESNFLSGSK
jgi:putative PIN family toxin of toxin-antitoxin system